MGCRFTEARALGRERWAYALEVDVEDPERPVVVDPLVLWNTYLGSAGQDELRDMALSAEGDVFIVGTVGGTPLSPPVDAGRGASDVLVARFQGDGGLAWSTLLGGPNYDRAYAVEVGLFAFAALCIGTMGSTPLAAHQIALQIVSVAFMVPAGMSYAITMRIGQHYGAGQLPMARLAGRVGIGFGAAVMLAFGAGTDQGDAEPERAQVIADGPLGRRQRHSDERIDEHGRVTAP